MSDSFNSFENRKKDHIRWAVDSVSQGRVSPQFEKIRLLHQALPEINFADVKLKTQLLDHEFSSPHFVSSMTAGHQQSLEINLRLARAAEKKNWMMAVGSQRRELHDQAARREWSQIREQAPGIKLISNIGISELITEPIENILSLAQAVQAIGFIIHLNPLQEVFQNPGNGQFKDGLKAIENFIHKSKLPVIVKEVGFGISEELATKLFQAGARAVDLAGHGGTHWAAIEAARQSSERSSSLDLQAVEAFNDWGYATVDLLLAWQDKALFHPVWASGGIRSGVDSAKCLALGARAVGIAQPLMKAAVKSEEDVLKVMETFDQQLKIAMFCSGVRSCEEFLHKKVWQCLK